MIPLTISLTAEEHVQDRPFTDPRATADDLEVLETIRKAQHTRLEQQFRDGTWVDRSGATHWLVAPRPERALDASPCLAVGFFGQARGNVDHTVIVRLEHVMLARADEIPGLISYHNVQLANAQWGNLVLFEAGTDTAPMRVETAHADAIGRAPTHYHSLRLHRGTIDSEGGVERLTLATTLYLDFAATPPWRAVRTTALTRRVRAQTDVR